MNKVSYLWKNYNLSIVLCALFLLSWIGQLVFQWQEFVSTAQAHHQSPQVIEYLPQFLSSTFENWQSEFLQLFTMVVATAYLVHKGSHESKDSDEEVTAKLNRIEKALKIKG